MRRTERDECIRVLRLEGRTLQEIAADVGVTRERVRQILVRIGGPTAAEVRAHLARQRREDREDLERRIRGDLDRHPGSTAEEVSQRLGVSRPLVLRSTPKDVRSLVVAPSGFAEQQWSDEQILDAIRTTATYAYPVSAADYERLLMSGEVTGPSVARITQRFANWGRACRSAGVEPRPPRRQHYQSRWTDEDMLAFVRDYLNDPDQPGTFAGYDPWRRQAGVEAPSSALLRTRMGSWSDIKRKALGR